MKRIIKYTAITIGILFSINANSQEYKTSESIASQIKNNKTPGLNYSAEKVSVKKTDSAPVEQNVAKAIKEGRLGGMKPASGQAPAGGGSVKTNSSSQTLASDMTPEQRKKELEEAKQSIKVIVPADQEVKEKR